MAILACLIIGGLAIAWLAPRALDTKAHLEDVVPLAKSVQSHLVKSETAEALHAAEEMESHTNKARELTSGSVWGVAEKVPWIGDNFKAVRLVAEAADELAGSAVVPIAQVDIDALKPVDGRVNVEAVRGLQKTVDSAYKALGSASERLARIDRDALIPQVAAGVEKLDGAIEEANGVVVGVKKAVDLLPSVLGADGTRHYLLLFENNSETRGWAGNPANVMLLSVDDGKIDIAQQADTTDFPHRDSPIQNLNPETEALYGDKIGRYIQDTTTTIDFRETAELATAFWKSEFGGEVDGVVTFDPVSLSYLLKATGPVQLATGETLTSDNAVSMLLNEAYFKYPDPKVQDAFFGAAAASIFDALTQGDDIDTKQLIDALGKAVNENRLLFYSFHEDEQEIIATTALDGIPDTSNDEKSEVGVFFDDTTGAKMDYYFKPSITIMSDQCTASAPSMTGSVEMTNDAPADAQWSLPDYVRGPFFKNGDIVMDVVLYGTVGGELGDFTLNGEPVDPTYVGEHLGRPAAKIYVRLSPQESATLDYTMTGPEDEGPYGPLHVMTTGLAHTTPIEIDAPGCDEG